MRIELDESRGQLLEAVKERREEILLAIAARVHAIGGTEVDPDLEYSDGLRGAIEAAVDDTISAADRDGQEIIAIPAPLLSQARLAARREVPLETIMRRYIAGHVVLGDFVVEEADRSAVAAGALRSVLRRQAIRTDQVVGAVAATYTEEARSARTMTADAFRALSVKRLLDGELLDPSVLRYDLDRWHVGIVAQGPESDAAIGKLTARVGTGRLVVKGENQSAWAWIGAQSKPQISRIAPIMASASNCGLRVGIGEPGRGQTGWRLTHQQARAALTVALRRPEGTALYAEVAVLAAALKDELLSNSLRALYLGPLEDGRDGGAGLRATLQAYLAANMNVSSTAAALGISRNAVANRLRSAETRIGHLSSLRVADLSIALQLADLPGRGTNDPVSPRPT